MSQAPIPERWREWQETKRKLSVPHYVLRNAIAEIADLEVRGRINAETLDELRDTIETLDAQVQQLRDALGIALPRIKAWAEEAYPGDVFPPPDWDEVRRMLGASLLARVSAANMRHVATRTWEILSPVIAALAATEPKETK